MTLEKNRKIEIDISGQIQQINYDSSLGFRRNNGIEKSVYLKSSTKKEVIKKYKGQVTNLIEKLHCIMIYYCIKDSLENVKEIKICQDVSFRRIKNLLPLLFEQKNSFSDIKIVSRKGGEPKSVAHRISLKAFRKRKYTDLLIKKEMIEDVLFEFKKK